MKDVNKKLIKTQYSMAATNKQLKRKHKPNLGKVKRCIYLAFFVAIVTPSRSVRVCVVSNCLEGKMQKKKCAHCLVYVR